MNRPRLLALFTISLWSWIGVLSRVLASRSQFLAVCLTFSFVTMTLGSIGIISNRAAFLRGLRSLRPADLLIAPFGYFVYWMGLVQCSRALGSQSQVLILNYTWPLFTVLFGVLIFRRGGRRGLAGWLAWAGVLLGFAAVAVLATQGRLPGLRFENPGGMLWGLLAGSAYGFFSAYSGGVSDEKQLPFLAAGAFISLLIALLLAGLGGELPLIWGFGPLDYLAALAVGVLLDGLGYAAWTRANRLAHEQAMDITALASMMLALPLFNLGLVALLLGEGELLRPWFLASLALLLASSVLCQRAEWLAGLIGAQEGA